MPVTKCSNGKWRIGSGPCRYSSKEKAEKAWAGARAAGAKSTVSRDLLESLQGLGRKYSKSEAGFLEDLGVRGLQCGDCINFASGGGACAIVEGIIDAGDVCNFFDQGLSIGDMPSVFAKSSFDMYISKASQDPETGERRWAAVASDTDKDSFDDRMSIDLFEDFIARIENGDPAPEVFASEAWNGGMPYLGLAHYLDLDGTAIIGDTHALYIDGNRLKAKGIFKSTPLGEAAFDAIKRDIKDDIPPEERIRISIAFVDWGHDHGKESFVRESLDSICNLCNGDNGDKIYRSGQLVHLALTRVPVNERTPIWLEERAMPKTMKEDALSVLGDEHEGLVEELDELSKKKKKKVYRSQAVVVKSEEDEPEVDEQEEEEELVKASLLGGATSFDDAEAYLKTQEEVDEVFDHFWMLDSILWNINMAETETVSDKPAAMSKAVNDFKERVDSAVKRSLTVRAAQMFLENRSEEGEPMTEEEKVIEEEPKTEETPGPVDPLDAALHQLKSAVLEATDGDGSIEDRLKAIQPVLNSLADTVRSTVEGEEVGNARVVAEAVSQAISKELAPLTEAIQLMAAKSQADGPRPEAPMVPGPRAYQPPPVSVENGGEKTKSPLTKMIRRSVGLKE